MSNKCECCGADCLLFVCLACSLDLYTDVENSSEYSFENLSEHSIDNHGEVGYI